MNAAARRRDKGWWLGVPGIGWLGMFLVLPLLAVFAVSFLTRGEYGGYGLPLTIENYRRLAGWGELGFDPLYPVILGRSLALGFGTAVLCFLLAVPLTFFIAGLGERRRLVALTLVMIPFWTNLLVRTYAWQLLLGPSSWLSEAAAAAGFISAGEGLYPSWSAVAIGMVADFLPFFALPLFASVEKLDWTLAEAAADLGANRWQVFRHAVWPQIRPGAVTGFVLVFLPATGQFVIPDLLGGAKTALLGNAIQQQFGQSRDWPFGAAMACVGLVIMGAGLFIQRRINRLKEAGL